MANGLIIRKSEWLDDWYVIETEESEWLSDASVEGTADHMLGIAQAITERGFFSERRCAVRCDGDNVRFWSPRNSQRPGVVSLALADDLARQIRETLAPPDSKGGGV